MLSNVVLDCGGMSEIWRAGLLLSGEAGIGDAEIEKYRGELLTLLASAKVHNRLGSKLNELSA
jgi:hypothetical protein